jgi:hypothetical protein
VRPDQLEQLRNLEHVNFKGYDFTILGCDQADHLLKQIREQQREISKTLLKKFYADHGHAIPEDFIDHCYDHPDTPWVQPKRHGCLFLLGVLGVLLLITAIGSFFTKPENKTAPPSTTTSSNPSPAEKLAPSPSFPDPRFWPKQVRISAPVELRGIVDGGLIHMTASPNDLLDATLSEDHKSVTLRRLDITGSLPLEETDFLERARQASTAHESAH